MKTIASIFLLCVVLFSSCTSVQISQRNAGLTTTVDFRLSNEVVPNKYELTLRAKPSDDKFIGQVAIEFSLMTARRDMVLHSQDLLIRSVKIFGDHGASRPTYVTKDGLLRIDFNEDLERGSYRAEITYEGKYSQDLSGLYRVREGDDAYLFTQFEPIAARKMLPCFDEPRFKTPFDISIITTPGHIVVANTPETLSNIAGDDEEHIFATTKPISTYLLALAIGPFDVVESSDIDNNRFRDSTIQFRGITTKGKGEKIAMAMRETPAILEKLETYFSVAYPYEKLDIIAVPDFAAGAMENVGAITFRDWYLLIDEQSASVEQQRDFYVVMAHELAHQWFGNTVTMPWWDDLWLNESFATWLSYKIVDDLKPELNVGNRLIHRAHSVMATDSIKSARKIREPVNSDHDIYNAFDGITYSKGGAVLNMIENYLGADKFREAVSLHINRFENKTATSRDFLESLAKFSDETLIHSAETFLNQTGVPEIKTSYTCNDTSLTFKFKQGRYVPIGSKLVSLGKWDIPVCINYGTSSTHKKHCFILKELTETITLNNEQCPQWVMPNANGQGYYRFSLSSKDWDNVLSSRNLSDGDRLALADSLIAQFYAGRLDFAYTINGLNRLIDKRSSLLTGYFINFLKEASSYWINEQQLPHALSYAHNALNGIYNDLMHQGNLTDEQKSLKAKIAEFLVHVVKDTNLRLEMSVIGNAYLQETLHEKAGLSPVIDDNILHNAVSVSLQLKDDNYLKKLFSTLNMTTNAVTRKVILYGLARSREGELAESVRELVFNKDLRKNEQMSLLHHHLENPVNQPSTWTFVKTSWPQLKKVLSESQIADLPYLARGLCESHYADEVREFFLPFITTYQGGPRNLAEITEQIEICAARKSYSTTQANQYFSERSSSTLSLGVGQ